MTVGRVVMQADGGSRGNPGPAGFGAVVFDESGAAVLAERFGFLGRSTNNVAEYSGVIAGLVAAAELGARTVVARLDSKLIVEQMSGRWQVKDPKILPLARRVIQLRQTFESVAFEWVPRERNKHADRLANLAMDRGSAGGVAAIEPGDPGLDPAVAAPQPAPEAVGQTPGAREIGPAGPVSGAGPATDAPTRIVIVRHGETTLGAAGRFAGQNDVPLTAHGRQQAVAVADRLAGLHPAAVWTSPLARCRETATSIGRRARTTVTVVDQLTDGQLGPWAGLTAQEIAERWPAEFAAWRTDVDVAPPGGESYAGVRRRAAAVLRGVVDRHRRQTVVLVTHSVTAKMMLIEALDVASPAVYRLRVDPASLSMIAVDAAGQTMVWTVNEIGHLPT
jgi:probable phosphoglycerate mutase